MERGLSRCLELFTGGGGLALGLDLAGFEHVGLVEWNRDACATLRANATARVTTWKADDVHEGDVRLFDFEGLGGPVDVIAAGVPCQPFSLGGVHRGSDDERNMFPYLLEGVRRMSPRAVLVENVPGLARPGFREYFEYIIAQMRRPFVTLRSGESWREHHGRLGKTRPREAEKRYRVEWRMINAANFGVPQRRTRVVIEAVREDVSERCVWPHQTHTESLLELAKVNGTYWRDHELPVPRESAVSLLPLGSGPSTERWRTLRDALRGLPAPGRDDRDPILANHVFIPGARVYAGHTGSLLDEPAKTLKAGVHGVPGGEGVIVLDDGAVRYMSVREAARVQTFPDAFRFVGSRSECMRQIGNAVPVRLAEVLGRALLELLTTGDAEAVAASTG